MSLPFYRVCQFMLWCIFKAWNRVELRASEKVPAQGFILAANHVSYLDPPVLSVVFRRPITFLAKEELFRIPVFRRIITWLNAVPVAGESDFRTLRAIVKRLRAGEIVLIFPEGTRSRTGDMSSDVKSGVAFLAHAAGVPVVPCYIDGTDKAWPRGGRWFRPAKIRVFLDKPVVVGESTEDKAEHYARSTSQVMERIKFLKDSAAGETGEKPLRGFSK